MKKQPPVVNQAAPQRRGVSPLFHKCSFSLAAPSSYSFFHLSLLFSARPTVTSNPFCVLSSPWKRNLPTLVVGRVGWLEFSTVPNLLAAKHLAALCVRFTTSANIWPIWQQATPTKKRFFFHYLPFSPLHPFPPSISNPFLFLLLFPSGEPFCSARFGASRFLLLFPLGGGICVAGTHRKRKKGALCYIQSSSGREP